MNFKLVILLMQFCMGYSDPIELVVLLYCKCDTYSYCSPSDGQSCPNGLPCDVNLLQCHNDLYELGFKNHYQHRDVHCDPYTSQLCPNGQLCDPSIFNCVEKYNWPWNRLLYMPTTS
eukprot:TRINITY_DN1543_c0_g1_i3.p1 TRINITY_DN1543_c0_g1~~TRINITY_DN1543_c0_g1_i3.p1  ORF type:complete len:117 (+),score=10.22 TRINITY_DN1543_c0_g1_i3:77-427(+)